MNLQQQELAGTQHDSSPSPCHDPKWSNECPELRASDPPPGEPDEPSDLEPNEPDTLDDAHWEAFIADDDERDPLPEPGDFWIENDRD